MSIVFSTCWYSLKAKFPESIYLEWMDNMLSQVHRYYLVLYIDEQHYSFFFSKYGSNPNIKIVIKPLEQFYNYRHKEFWIENHRNNPLLNQKINWELNMLWSEKVHFVNETRLSHYFPETDYYGWIDIGYFRCRTQLDIQREAIQNFPNPEKVRRLNPNKIHYALVHSQYFQQLMEIIKQKRPIPQNQISIGGGCFIGHKDKIEWWKTTFQNKLESYITVGQVVKDDQIIIVDCVFNDILNEGCANFDLHQETNPSYDPWFLFSRSLQ
jgi:hypothetical protein